MAVPVTVLLVLVVNQSGLRSNADPPASPSPSASPAPGPLPPLDVTAPPASPAADQYCPRFVAALPVTLDGLAARTARSDSPNVGAWGEPPVVFRCGVSRPAALVPTAELQVINGVDWLTEERGDVVVWTAVDRPVYVEMTVPLRYAAAPISGVTGAVTTLPRRPVTFD